MNLRVVVECLNGSFDVFNWSLYLIEKSDSQYLFNFLNQQVNALVFYTHFRKSCLLFLGDLQENIWKLQGHYNFIILDLRDWSLFYRDESFLAVGLAVHEVSNQSSKHCIDENWEERLLFLWIKSFCLH